MCAECARITRASRILTRGIEQPAAGRESAFRRGLVPLTVDTMNRMRWIVLGLVAVATSACGDVKANTTGGDANAEQPIAFSHVKHAGPASQIPCMYCHNSADRSEDAGIPAVQVCAGCHIPGGVPMVRKDSTGVQQLVEYWTEQRPIPWVRIHKLPDHVHFPHMMHVNADVTCQECHGQVQEMTEIERVAPLSMGWCVQCHEARAVRTDCFVCHY